MHLERITLICRAIQTLQIQVPEATLQTKPTAEMASVTEVNHALLALLIAVRVQIILCLQIPIILAQILQIQAIIVPFRMALLLKTTVTVMKIPTAQAVTIVRKAVVQMRVLALAEIMKTPNDQA